MERIHPQWTQYNTKQKKNNIKCLHTGSMASSVQVLEDVAVHFVLKR